MVTFGKGDYYQLNKLTALRSLGLVAIEGLPGATCFSSLTNLTRLSLCATIVAKEGLADSLAGMKKLQVLDMSHACGTVERLSTLLTRLTWLKTLQLSRGDMTELIIQIEGLEALLRVQDGLPALRLKVLARLQQALPGLTLEVKGP